MDVPCPKCNSTDLKKVSLAYEEGLCQSDKRPDRFQKFAGRTAAKSCGG